MPLDPFSDSLYDATKKGVIPCKIINCLFPNTIDERAINKSDNLFYASHRVENLQLALSAARCNGCAVKTITVDDLMGARTYFKLASLEFFKQVILKGFFRKINIHEHPEILTLRHVNEDLNDLRCLSPELVLIRYVNYHLKSSGITKTLTSFEYDLSDCMVYAHLLYKIAPVTVRPRLLPADQVLLDNNIGNRAKAVLQNLRELGAEMFLCEDDFVHAEHHRESRGVLHLITVAFLFDRFAGEMKAYGGGDFPVSKEDVNELSSRNFVNSLNVSPYCTHIISNLRDGLIAKQIFEILRPGFTTGLKFTHEFDFIRRDAQFLQNNTCILRLVQGYPFRLPSLDAERLTKSDQATCEALLLQMLRSYLTRDAYDEHELLRWVNDQLARAGKPIELRSFSDRIIADECLFAVVLNNLVSGLVSRDCLRGKRHENARYYISIAHKAGFRVYTRPEHFDLCSPRWVAIAFAALRWG
ncbi:unnamed protein product [Mesocestoides corti]|uniref:Plastin-3 n=1 Tax=Mesocestoides corti TaxID=53468 RepID=A0A0R3UHC2_MESCO|nr:unnamed protein product [Mesocestoides corti]